MKINAIAKNLNFKSCYCVKAACYLKIETWCCILHACVHAKRLLACRTPTLNAFKRIRF